MDSFIEYAVMKIRFDNAVQIVSWCRHKHKAIEATKNFRPIPEEKGKCIFRAVGSKDGIWFSLTNETLHFDQEEADALGNRDN